MKLTNEQLEALVALAASGDETAIKLCNAMIEASLNAAFPSNSRSIDDAPDTLLENYPPERFRRQNRGTP